VDTQEAVSDAEETGLEASEVAHALGADAVEKRELGSAGVEVEGREVNQAERRRTNGTVRPLHLRSRALVRVLWQLRARRLTKQQLTLSTRARADDEADARGAER